MDLLFKRKQAPTSMSSVKFKLWGKIELTEEEQDLIKRYRFHDAILVAVIQPTLVRNAILIALVAMIPALAVGVSYGAEGLVVGALVAVGAGFWYFNSARETVYVKDLIHGRHFSCDSVVDLARKEAWLETVVGFLRQVMESAKHWDGTECHTIEALPKDEARQVILKGL